MNNGPHSTFDDAKDYFATHPGSVKFKKLNKLLGRSYLIVKNIVYSVFNRHSDPDAVLGAGGQGTVKLVETESHDIYKVKIEKGTLAAQNQDGLEIEAQRKQLIGFVENPHNDKVYKISEYIPGNTLAHEINTGSLSVIQKFIIAIKLCHKIQELHNTYTALHGDIKSLNIIIQRSDPSKENCINVEIIDFGTSKKLPSGHSEVKSINGIGTNGYRAPEINDSFIYSIASDVYALGYLFKNDLKLPEVTLNKLSHTNLPFRHHRPTLDKILTVLASDLSNEPSLDSEARTVINSVNQCQNVTLTSNMGFTDVSDFKPLLNLIPRTTQSALLHGNESTIDFEGTTWTKISSQTNFTHNTNRYWVSLGSSLAREKIFFDSESNKILELTKLMIPPATLETPHNIFIHVNNVINNIPTIQGIQNVVGYTNVRLDELIDKGQLVCRHKVLIAAKGIATLISRGLLPEGPVRCYRTEQDKKPNSAHTFVTYRHKETNELWIIDPTWNRTYNLSGSQIPYHRLDELADRGQVAGADAYGTLAITDMIKRLDYEDIYKPFIEIFKSHIIKGSFPQILQIFPFEGINRFNRLEIRLSLHPSLNENSIAILMKAFSLQNIRSTFIADPQRIISLICEQPAHFLRFSINDFINCLSYKYSFRHLTLSNSEREQASSIRNNFKQAIATNNYLLLKWLTEINNSVIYTRIEINAFFQAVKRGCFEVFSLLIKKRSKELKVKALLLAAQHNQVEIFLSLTKEISLFFLDTVIYDNIMLHATDNNSVDIFKHTYSVRSLPSNSSLTILSLYQRALNKNSFNIVKHIEENYPHRILPTIVDLTTPPILTYLYKPSQNGSTFQQIAPTQPIPILPKRTP